MNPRYRVEMTSFGPIFSNNGNRLEMYRTKPTTTSIIVPHPPPPLLPPSPSSPHRRRPWRRNRSNTKT
ncbi:hypothetical protein ACS0TY_013381 [Phlomoides rotata]